MTLWPPNHIWITVNIRSLGGKEHAPNPWTQVTLQTLRDPWKNSEHQQVYSARSLYACQPDQKLNKISKKYLNMDKSHLHFQLFHDASLLLADIKSVFFFWVLIVIMQLQMQSCQTKHSDLIGFCTKNIQQGINKEKLFPIFCIYAMASLSVLYFSSLFCWKRKTQTGYSVKCFFERSCIWLACA